MLIVLNPHFPDATPKRIHFPFLKESREMEERHFRLWEPFPQFPDHKNPELYPLYG
jgi:hypothetical protein